MLVTRRQTVMILPLGMPLTSGLPIGSEFEIYF